jgi:hypothetical protein
MLYWNSITINEYKKHFTTKYDMCFANCIIWNKIIYILFYWQIWDLLLGV